MPKTNEFLLKLKVIIAQKDDIRRGWVRIPEARRDGIEYLDLVRIRSETGKTCRRIVLGTVVNKDYANDTIELDEITRKELGIEEEINKLVEFKITRYTGLRKWLASIAFYYQHPDPPMRFSSRVAVLSFLLGLIGLSLGLLTMLR